MKKKIQALCASFFMGILFLMVGIPILAEPSYETKFSDWGNLCRLPRLLTQQGLTTIERVDDAG